MKPRILLCVLVYVALFGLSIWVATGPVTRSVSEPTVFAMVVSE
jgi:hypothetical protein